MTDAREWQQDMCILPLMLSHCELQEGLGLIQQSSFTFLEGSVMEGATRTRIINP